jgi:hypothetical protein
MKIQKVKWVVSDRTRPQLAVRRNIHKNSKTSLFFKFFGNLSLMKSINRPRSHDLRPHFHFSDTAGFAEFSKILEKLPYFSTWPRVMSMIQIWRRLLAIFLLLHPLHPERQKCFPSNENFFDVIFLQRLRVKSTTPICNAISARAKFHLV